ncbi:MAG: DUF928 domain-containing protein [Myxococcales bacterium]|nr:DUF928 domain-containing protein [Myxococcales bacterium]
MRACCLILATLGLAFTLPLSAAASNAEKSAAASNAEKSAEEEPAQRAKAPDVAAAPLELPLYQPPARGKPRSRVGSAVRSAGQQWPALTALVPEHTGLTASEGPSLFWHVDEAPPSDALVVFALTDEEHLDPLVEVELTPPKAAGIQRIDLGQLGVELRSGSEYQWSVALVVDADQRARDVVAVGYVERVQMPSGLANLSNPTARELAAHGLWYDALTAAEDQIRSDPEDLEPRRARDGLLRQAGLEAAVPASGN